MCVSVLMMKAYVCSFCLSLCVRKSFEDVLLSFLVCLFRLMRVHADMLSGQTRSLTEHESKSEQGAVGVTKRRFKSEVEAEVQSSECNAEDCFWFILVK